MAGVSDWIDVDESRKTHCRFFPLHRELGISEDLEQGKVYQVAIIRRPNFMPLDLPQEA